MCFLYLFGRSLHLWIGVEQNCDRLLFRRNFSSKKLQGPIPAEIANLTELNEMYISLSAFIHVLHR
jgi:hypothetical protein